MTKSIISSEGNLYLEVFCTNVTTVMKNNTKKNALEQYVTNDHIKYTICTKKFPTTTSLNIHITAVHDDLKVKHKLEREPSLKNHKIRRPA